jgi:hypothetical protein
LGVILVTLIVTTLASLARSKRDRARSVAEGEQRPSDDVPVERDAAVQH